jgi:hypothetical protein
MKNTKNASQLKEDLNKIAGQIAFDEGFEEGNSRINAISGDDYYFGFIAAIIFNMQETLSPKDMKELLKDCKYPSTK